ncbi:hypothetical protein NC652_039257 [Populus alba x Populus x berolinensis]|nr:hypothetical protein NC652_039257 [Populus alba x Populus x berolinensis]
MPLLPHLWSNHLSTCASCNNSYSADLLYQKESMIVIEKYSLRENTNFYNSFLLDIPL